MLGAASIFIAPVIVGLSVEASRRGRDESVVASSGLLDAVKTLVLPNDVSSIFHAVSGATIDNHERLILPPVGPAIGMVGAIFLLGALVVIRRARTVEVVA